jgi:anaerobic selenocysteine-containing dehydrogenase
VSISNAPSDDIVENQVGSVAAAAAVAPAVLPGVLPIAAGVVLGLASWNFIKGVLAEDKKNAGDNYRRTMRGAP